ncbi:hypothetical protein TNCV_1932211 [Trichonephila clavipes]|nr:hypothetical protein TNCV_1932211 [Trichonephila clavipes]
MQQIRIFKQRNPRLIQVESHTQDSSAFPMKGNQERLGKPRDWSTTPYPSQPKRRIQVCCSSPWMINWGASSEYHVHAFFSSWRTKVGGSGIAAWVAWLVCRWPAAPKAACSTPAEGGGFS